MIFSVKKSGGEKWRGYLCLTEVKSFSPRPAASLLTTRQPSPPANTHLVRSPLHTSCHSTEALTRPSLLKHLQSNVKSFQVSRRSSVFLCFCARGEAELRGRAQRQVHQVQGQLFFFFFFPFFTCVIRSVIAAWSKACQRILCGTNGSQRRRSKRGVGRRVSIKVYVLRVRRIKKKKNRKKNPSGYQG